MTAPPGPRLAVDRRLRVMVRRTLFAVLRAVPGGVVTAVHDRWIGPTGRCRAVWRPVVALLFYRPIPGSSIRIPGGAGERLRVVGSRMERTLWWYGEAGYEHGEAARWRELCAGAGDVLEIGANIGFYTVVGARATSGRYTTVEPNPHAASVVRANLALNGVTGVHVVEGAVVGDGAPDEVELALPDQEAHSTAPTGAFLRSGTEAVADRPASRSLRVPTVAAGGLFAGRDLVKLDIEGSEATVLEAALDEIRRSRPMLVVEVLDGSVRLREVISCLLADGYGMWAAEDPDRPLDLVDLQDGYRDVLLAPPERASLSAR